MKIVGRTSTGYLMSVSLDEIANICGFPWSTHPDFESLLRKIGALDTTQTHNKLILREGVEIPVSAIFQRLTALRDKSDAVKKGAATMRLLADLMEGSLPEMVAPVEPTAEPEQENSDG